MWYRDSRSWPNHGSPVHKVSHPTFETEGRRNAIATTYLSKEHVGRETTFGSIGVYELARCVRWSPWGKGVMRGGGNTLLCALLPFTFGFDVFGHVCKVYYRYSLQLLCIRRKTPNSPTFHKYVYWVGMRMDSCLVLMGITIDGGSKSQCLVL